MLSKVLLAILFGIIAFVTVVGNIMVMVSFKMDKRLQTISNYFLFRCPFHLNCCIDLCLYLASLAIADFIIGAYSIPFFTIQLIENGKWPLRSVKNYWNYEKPGTFCSAKRSVTSGSRSTTWRAMRVWWTSWRYQLTGTSLSLVRSRTGPEGQRRSPLWWSCPPGASPRSSGCLPSMPGPTSRANLIWIKKRRCALSSLLKQTNLCQSCAVWWPSTFLFQSCPVFTLGNKILRTLSRCNVRGSHTWYLSFITLTHFEFLNSWQNCLSTKQRITRWVQNYTLIVI